MVPKMEACLRAVRGGVPRGARRSTAGCRTRCCSRCSPTRASARWWCRDERATSDSAAAVGRRADAQLRHAAARPGPRRGLRRLGRRRQRLPRPARRHRGQRRSATPTRPCVEAVDRQVATLAHTSQPVHARAGGRAGRAAGRRSSARRRPGLLRQLRRRGQRGRVQAVPAAPARAAQVVAAERLPRPHHGRARADRQAGEARAVPAAAGDVTYVPYGDADALARRGRRRRPRWSILEPILGENGVVAAAGRLPARRARRSATRPARCSSSTRCRPASAGPAPGSPTRPRASSRTSSPGQGARRRPADRRCLAFGAAADAAQPGRPRHRRSAATRSSCAAALAVLDTIETRRPARPRRRARRRLAARRRRRRAPAGRRGARQRPVARRSCSPSRCRAASRPAARERRLPGQRAAPDAIRLAPPLILTDDRPTRSSRRCPASSNAAAAAR